MNRPESFEFGRWLQARPETESNPDQGSELLRLSEDIRVQSLQKLNFHRNRKIMLPDGSETLVIGNALEIGPDTFTIRHLSCEDAPPECIEVVAAKRGADGRAEERCAVQIYPGRQADFDFCSFNETFDFTPHGTVVHEERLRQFYYPLIEANPVPADSAERMVRQDWDDGVFGSATLKRPAARPQPSE